MLGAMCLSTAALAIDKHIDVFTTYEGVKRLQLSRLKQITDLPINVHYVDAIKGFSQFLGGKVNTNRKVTQQEIKRIKQQVQAKLSSAQMADEKKKLVQGLKTYQKVKALGITKIPAVVFDDKYVIYGSDVVKAMKLYYQSVPQS